MTGRNFDRMPLILLNQEWVHEAACRDADPELFFPEGKGENIHLLRIAQRRYCNECPVIAECYTYAVKAGEVGIWGGVLLPLRSRPRGPDPHRPVPVREERAVVIPRRMREPDEEPGWMRHLMRRFSR